MDQQQEAKVIYSVDLPAPGPNGRTAVHIWINVPIEHYTALVGMMTLVYAQQQQIRRREVYTSRGVNPIGLV